MLLTLMPMVAMAVPLPQPNQAGDYGRTSHENWVVVDADPRGVNCRWSSRMPKDWYSPAAKLPPLTIDQWPVVQRYQKGTNLKTNITPAGFAIFYDGRRRPWLKVSLGSDDRICFVRANSRFVRPVQP